MHKTKSVLENGTQEILVNFQSKTDQLIPVRRPNQLLKKKLPSCGFCRPIDPQSVNERKRKDKYLDLAKGNEAQLQIVRSERSSRVWTKEWWNWNSMGESKRPKTKL